MTSFKQVARHKMAFLKQNRPVPAIFLKTSHNTFINFVPNYSFKIIERFGTNFVTRLWG
jgi:ribosomal protein L39E